MISTGWKGSGPGLLLLSVILLTKFGNAVAMNNGGITWQKSMLDLFPTLANANFRISVSLSAV